MKRLLIICLSAAVTALFIIACSDTGMGMDAGSDENSSHEGENFTFHKNAALAEETSANRSSDISDPFEINDVRIVDETITLDLYEIFEDVKFMDEAIFTVLNASKSSTENDYKVER